MTVSCTKWRQGQKPTSVSIKARKYGGADFWKSRSGVKCLLVPRQGQAAGINLDKAGMQPENEDGYSQYKKFDIEFENENSELS